VYEVRGDQIYDTAGNRIYTIRGNKIYDTFGNWKYEIRDDPIWDGSVIYDTSSNRLATET
jgi:hypothetical protein